MNFNFDDALKAKESGTLAPGIKKAIFKGVNFSTLTSQKSGDAYKTLVLKVEIENYGEYTQNFFEPTSDVRTDGTYGKQPSRLDHFLITVREILEAVNPEFITEINNGTKVLTGSFKQVVDTVKVWTDPYINKELYVKLIPGNNGYVSMPSYPARITKNGDLGIATRFIGQNLTLTSSEQKKIDAANSAKPTTMSDKNGFASKDILDSVAEADDDLPFD